MQCALRLTTHMIARRYHCTVLCSHAPIYTGGAHEGGGEPELLGGPRLLHVPDGRLLPDHDGEDILCGVLFTGSCDVLLYRKLHASKHTSCGPNLERRSNHVCAWCARTVLLRAASRIVCLDVA
jgi:hypothetical protein